MNSGQSWKPDGIFIPGNVASLKNSKKIIQIGPKGNRTPRLVPSDRHKAYEQESLPFWLMHAAQFRSLIRDLPQPYHVRFYFVRDSRRKFDYDNAIATCQDLMVSAKWLPADDCDTLIPGLLRGPDGTAYAVDRHRPGVWVSPEL